MSTGKDDNPHTKKITHIIIPLSNFFKLKQNDEIYSGNEYIPFRNRHPIFKSLMRIEFEDAIMEYLKSLKSDL